MEIIKLNKYYFLLFNKLLEISHVYENAYNMNTSKENRTTMEIKVKFK